MCALSCVQSSVPCCGPVSERPSVWSNMLCRMQHTLNSLPTSCISSYSDGVFRFLNRLFMMPNVHSASLRVDSSRPRMRFPHVSELGSGHCKKRHLWYPLSTRTYKPFMLVVVPSALKSLKRIWVKISKTTHSTQNHFLSQKHILTAKCHFGAKR